MQQFVIRDIENLTGIKAHTLRMWEQRYEMFRPKRSQTQRRFYDNEDLKQLLRIAYLYHHGWKISKIAALSEQQLVEEVQKAGSNGGGHAQFVIRLIEAALDFDAPAFLSVIDEAANRLGFEDTVVSVCYPYLQRIGLLWSTSHVIPAQEHFSSYLLQNRIISETERLPLPERPPEIVLLCPKGEFHELPLLFLHYLFRRHGWSVLYLGTNIGKKEIRQLAAHTHIRYLYLHLITNFTGMQADDYMEDLCRSFAGKKIVASGEGTRFIERSFTNLRLLRSDAEIRRFIGSLRPAAERNS